MAVLPGMRLIKAKIVSGVRDLDTQIQPAGVDLTVRRIETFTSKPLFSASSVEASASKEAPRRGSVYLLKPGPYRLMFSEAIKIPNTCCGLVFPRSSLLRSGVTIHTAIWDPGYGGRGQVLLSVLNRKGATISVGARVAQLMVFQLSGRPHRIYSGRYHREGMEATE